MPFYRTNLGIFFNKTYLQDPVVSSFIDEDIKYEDVNAWEILHEELEGNQIKIGIYAAFDPYGEFYMIKNQNEVIEFFGESAPDDMEKYLQKENISYRLNDKISIGSKTIFEEVK